MLEYFMVPVMTIISILAIIGTLYNKRTGNTAGFIIGAGLTAGIVLVSILSIIDMICGLT